jgi:hypothetical protein
LKKDNNKNLRATKKNNDDDNFVPDQRKPLSLQDTPLNALQILFQQKDKFTIIDPFVEKINTRLYWSDLGNYFSNLIDNIELSKLEKKIKLLAFSSDILTLNTNPSKWSNSFSNNLTKNRDLNNDTKYINQYHEKDVNNKIASKIKNENTLSDSFDYLISGELTGATFADTTTTTIAAAITKDKGPANALTNITGMDITTSNALNAINSTFADTTTTTIAAAITKDKGPANALTNITGMDITTSNANPGNTNNILNPFFNRYEIHEHLYPKTNYQDYLQEKEEPSTRNIPNKKEKINERTDSKPLNNILNSENKNTDTSKINIFIDSLTNGLTNKYNADAITFGSNIIFAKDKFDIHTPQGISLLMHELTHVYQLRQLQNYHSSENINNIAYNLKDSLEKEAQDTEQYFYNYFLLSLKNQQTDKKKYFSNDFSNRFNNPIISNLHSTNYYTINNTDKNYNRLNNMPISDLSLANNLRFNLESDSSSKLMPFLTESIFKENNFNINPRLPSLGDSLHSFQGNNAIQEDNYNPSNSSYPYLSFNIINYVNNSNSFVTSKANNNSSTSTIAAATAASKGAAANTADNNNNYPVMPFFLAERSRNISADNSIDLSSNQQSQISIPFISPINNTSMPRFSIYDIEIIAEKVYQILQNKIKIQRVRRGIR